jgi:aminoglycoside phosphotransferase (APT) family kinase protein
MTCEEMVNEGKKFYLTHADSRGDQFLTKDGRITAILDWEW